MKCSRPHCSEPVLFSRKPSRAEFDWMDRLEAVLMDAPRGIGLLTIGDAGLLVYDAARAKAHGIEHLHEGGAMTHGLILGEVSSEVKIEGVSG